MFKITLYDMNCCPICDGTISFYVDNLEDFERKWLPLQANRDIKVIDKYFKSKHGEIKSDYYIDNEEYNIVQVDKNAEILEEKTFNYTDKLVTIFNAYRYSTEIEFDELEIKLRKIKYNGKYILVGGYKGKGCKRIQVMFNRWKNEETKYAQMNFYGNSIATYYKRRIDWDKQLLDDAFKDFYTNNKAFYKDEEVETFVWLFIKELDQKQSITALTQKEIGSLMRDIVGEAG